MLTPEEKEQFKAKLERVKKDIGAEVENLSAHDGVTDFGSDVDHLEEEADEAEELGNQLGIVQALKERLNDVEHALAKFAGGRYGVCEKCGHEIEKELLMAAAESRLCRDCKAALK
ncbi:MAG: TraR/DksA C4-type zinc finger protein [bacterium]|nr:TraR/DksA C4-type zinc finger protein [bacterium]